MKKRFLKLLVTVCLLAAALPKCLDALGLPPLSEWRSYADLFSTESAEVWTANCNEFISLRPQTDSAENLAKIPVGASMKLLGWDGRYARVSYEGLEGYVMSSYIKPKNAAGFRADLPTVPLTSTYTYERMQKDLKKLGEEFPDSLTVSSIGKSEEGRKLSVLRIGSENAGHHVLLQGSIHGREHMTAWLLTAMADYWLRNDISRYGDVCFHIIPMSNPDGVTISQTGKTGQAQEDIYQADLKSGRTTLSREEYAAHWKSNATGTDLNCNFPAGWEEVNGRPAPSCQDYAGESPFSAAETQALRDYTKAYAFDATVSYHVSGSLIYWEYGTDEGVNRASRSLAQTVGKTTGYPTMGAEGVSGAGYKDWAIGELGIPSLTIEAGCQEAPLAERELYSIFARNRMVLPEIARWVQK